MDMEYKWIPLESDVHAMAKKKVRLAKQGDKGGVQSIVELIESAVMPAPEESEL